MQDFLMYAELQQARDSDARRLVEERNALRTPLAPAGLATSSAYAAIPVRYVLERGRWSEAAALATPETGFPQGDAIVYFGRALGAARSGRPANARRDIQKLEALRDSLRTLKDAYWANQVEIQRLATSAWLAQAEGHGEDAAARMRAAADLEDASEKHIAMENRLIPMRELLGELLLAVHQPADALREFESSLTRAPNRFRSFFGAARAAESAGDREKARTYYSRLTALVGDRGGDRPEVATATAFLSK
jgi:predicted Zn-dependent protease